MAQLYGIGTEVKTLEQKSIWIVGSGGDDDAIVLRLYGFNPLTHAQLMAAVLANEIFTNIIFVFFLFNSLKQKVKRVIRQKFVLSM